VWKEEKTGPQSPTPTPISIREGNLQTKRPAWGPKLFCHLNQYLGNSFHLPHPSKCPCMICWDFSYPKDKRVSTVWGCAHIFSCLMDRKTFSQGVQGQHANFIPKWWKTLMSPDVNSPKKHSEFESLLKPLYYAAGGHGTTFISAPELGEAPALERWSWGVGSKYQGGRLPWTEERLTRP
jgi:hypothetical protein